MSDSPLDRAVQTARDELDFAGVPAPQVLFLMGTGVGVLHERLGVHGSIRLETVAGIPEAWRDVTLHHGILRTGDRALALWMMDDLSADGAGAGEPWVEGFPAWLAAAAGAAFIVHTSAGSALDTGDEPPCPPGSIAVVTDHLNLSGRTPLLGLGETRLGPLFPDLSRLHHAGLREAAVQRAAEIGLTLHPQVAACTLGPTRDTPAERRYYARAGAGVAVQGLAAPLLAAAHGGLSALALVAVTDAGDREVDLVELLRASQEVAPHLDDLLFALGPDLVREARASTQQSRPT